MSSSLPTNEIIYMKFQNLKFVSANLSIEGEDLLLYLFHSKKDDNTFEIFCQTAFITYIYQNELCKTFPHFSLFFL